MKSSNPQVMVQAYRLLVRRMQEEFDECYPLHLGVTEAGDGEDGRIKSAIGIGTLLEEGIGDTIRVSLTEDPEFEIPVCRDLVKKYAAVIQPPPLVLPAGHPQEQMDDLRGQSFLSEPSVVIDRSEQRNASVMGNAGGNGMGTYTRRPSCAVQNIGGTNVPVVVADFMQASTIQPEDLRAIGYTYDAVTDKWAISDGAADYIFLGNKTLDFEIPGTLRPVVSASFWSSLPDRAAYTPCYELHQVGEAMPASSLSFVAVYLDDSGEFSDGDFMRLLRFKENVSLVLCLIATSATPAFHLKHAIAKLNEHAVHCPIIIGAESMSTTVDEQLIDFSTAAGSPLLDGIGDGVWLMNDPSKMQNTRSTGRTYLPVENNHQFLNNTAFSILQATRTRISKTEYISCPSCGRTLFDLQETTAKIRAATHHLKGIKIAIMGCIVNGPGEMADADFGYVGSGPGKITLYRGKEVVKRSVDSDVAVEELINLLKENGAWVERETAVPVY
jgi:(E)-4-hydroxy-3-methylbut-2-enyl-diphosphate synthase